MPGPSETGALVGVGVACGGAGVACGDVGLAGMWTTAIGPGVVAAAVGCVRTGAEGTGDGCAEGTGEGAMDGAGVCSSPGPSDERGPAGVGFTAGRVGAGVGLAAPGPVGVVVANAVPELGTAPMPGVGIGAESPTPSATVARTRFTTPRASTRRRRCVPLTWILGSPKATGGRRPAAPWPTMVAPV